MEPKPEPISASKCGKHFQVERYQGRYEPSIKYVFYMIKTSENSAITVIMASELSERTSKRIFQCRYERKVPI